MTKPMAFPCDGCGQMASPEHMARRLQRLEWSTRYRPVHISTLFLGAFSPQEDRDFLYSPGGEFHGEATVLLDALNIETKGKTGEVVHTDFQRAGYFVTYLLECPLDHTSGNITNTASLLVDRLPAAAARIRRSLKPKRVVLVSQAFEPVLEAILALDLGCPIVLDSGRPYALDSSLSGTVAASLRGKLSGPA
jgi:hypothetical protein